MGKFLHYHRLHLLDDITMMVDNGQPVEDEEGNSMLGGLILLGIIVSSFSLGYAWASRNNQSPTAMANNKMRCVVTNESTVTGNTLARSGEWREFDLECVEIDKP